MSLDSETTGTRVLDPLERSSEVLFGLIMVLTFTGSMSAATAGREEVRALLIGAIGCNLAWGLVDAVMYVLSAMTERARHLTLLRRLNETRAASETRRMIADGLPEELASAFTDEVLDTIANRLRTLPTSRQRGLITFQDIRGAFGVFLLVFLSTFPVVIPFVLFDDIYQAMRWSNGVAVLMMFFAGFSIGRYSGIGSFRIGLVMVVLGVILVGITIALGG